MGLLRDPPPPLDAWVASISRRGVISPRCQLRPSAHWRCIRLEASIADVDKRAHVWRASVESAAMAVVHRAEEVSHTSDYVIIISYCREPQVYE